MAATAALGQTDSVKARAPAAPEASTSPGPTGISTGLPFYGVDDAMRLKIRDLEYKSDQLEIEIQRMKVKIEEDKAAEIAIWKEITKAAQEYAKDKNIDPDRFDFDAAEPNYVQKKHHDAKKD
jgi:hypothetical protein